MPTYRESKFRIVKHVSTLIFAGCFLVEFGSNPAMGQAKGPARVFTPALEADPIQNTHSDPAALEIAICHSRERDKAGFGRTEKGRLLYIALLLRGCEC